MFIDDPAYVAALSQLAKALANFDPGFVHGLLEENSGVELLHDLSVAFSREAPDFYARLEALLAA